MNFSANIFSAGKPIHFEFSGNNFDDLNRVVSQTKSLLNNYAGIYDLTDSEKSMLIRIQSDTYASTKTGLVNMQKMISDSQEFVPKGFRI